MRKIKVLGTVFIMCALIMSMGAMVFGYEDKEIFFENKKVTNNEHYTSTSFAISEEDTYPTHFMWKSNKTTGNYYLGFDQKRADGTYGGGSRTLARVLSSSVSGGKVFRGTLHEDRWKVVISGSANANFYTNRVIVYHN